MFSGLFTMDVLQNFIEVRLELLINLANREMMLIDQKTIEIVAKFMKPGSKLQPLNLLMLIIQKLRIMNKHAE